MLDFNESCLLCVWLLKGFFLICCVVVICDIVVGILFVLMDIL